MTVQRDSGVRQHIVVSWHGSRFRLNADLNEQTWLWNATFKDDATHQAVEPKEGIVLSARHPHRCLSKALEWLLGAGDRGDLSHHSPP